MISCHISSGISKTFFPSLTPDWPDLDVRIQQQPLLLQNAQSRRKAVSCTPVVTRIRLPLSATAKRSAVLNLEAGVSWTRTAVTVQRCAKNFWANSCAPRRRLSLLDAPMSNTTKDCASNSMMKRKQDFSQLKKAAVNQIK
jgi:hypothetical protein